MSDSFSALEIPVLKKSGDHILKSLGIDYEEKLNLAYMGYGATANAIQDGTIVGMNIPAGPPVTGVTRAFAMVGEKLSLLSFTDADIVAINKTYLLWSRFVIPADTYPNQPDAIQGVAHPNLLVVRDDIPEDEVYQITKTLWENLAALREIHKATSSVSLETALTGVGAPLHPGAIRYYREIGIEIPEALIPR